MTKGHRGPQRSAAPSQTAHAEMPFCQYLSSPGMCIRLAVAPVAIMSDWVRTGCWSSLPSAQILNGRDDRSTFETVSLWAGVEARPAPLHVSTALVADPAQWCFGRT